MTSLEPMVIVGIVGNVVATVGVVLVNKYLWVIGFQYMVTLSSFHFVFTSICTRFLLKAGFFGDKPLNFWGVLPVCVGSCGSIVFMNLNLAWNSVGFYQISKLACIPLTLLLEYLMNNKRASQNVQLSLVVILAGVGVATVSDLEMNMVGSIFATIAIIFTTLAQIYTSTRQKELGLDALQLLHQSGPFISMGMMMAIPFLDNVWTAPSNKRPLVQFEWDAGTLGLIFVTCVFALLVNVTNYYVIGKTSPVTYQVVGHFKTILILTLGYVAFSAEVNYTNLFGVSIAVVGMILYGEIKRREGAASSTSSSAAAAAAARAPTVAVVADRDRVDTSSDRAASAAGSNGVELEPLVRVDKPPQ